MAAGAVVAAAITLLALNWLGGEPLPGETPLATREAEPAPFTPAAREPAFARSEPPAFAPQEPQVQPESGPRSEAPLADLLSEETPPIARAEAPAPPATATRSRSVVSPPASPEVERIHILAHSRGTDVVTTALRELVIETRAAGKNPRERLRIANLVLAAPDLDLDIVRQRLMAEKFGPAIGQITIYTTQADKALGASQTLMSGTRFGRMQEEDLGERERQIFKEVANVNIIEVQGVGGVGHAYFRTSPAASSDLVLILHDGSRPGEPARPLTHEVLNFWTMPKDYPGPVSGTD